VTSTNVKENGVVSLSKLARELASDVSTIPTAYVVGKTALRDAVMRLASVSAMRAEALVDAMERQGLVVHERSKVGTQSSARWRFT